MNGARSDSSLILGYETITYHRGSLPGSAGTVLAVNSFGAEQLGYTVEELAGRSVLHVFYEPDREAVQRKITLCLEQYCPVINWEAPIVLIHGGSGGQS